MSQSTLAFRVLTNDDFTARRLLLSLTSVEHRREHAISHLVAAGRIFGIEPAAIRMAAARLTADGLLAHAGRGAYRSGPAAAAMTAHIHRWRHVLTQMRDWEGDWLLAHISHLGRTDRKALRARHRALRYNGFAETPSGLWLRPNNLVASYDEMRAKLTGLGLDEEAVLAVANPFHEGVGFDPQSLWSADALHASYRAAIDAMAESTANIDQLSQEQAVREIILVGQPVVRTINIDPLLPNQIVDQDLLAEMVDAMIAYNDLGTRKWDAFFDAIDKGEVA